MMGKAPKGEAVFIISHCERTDSHPHRKSYSVRLVSVTEGPGGGELSTTDDLFTEQLVTD